MKRSTWLIALLCVACGGASHPHAPTIDELRARARERPTDPAAQFALAEGELLMRGGDAGAVAEQIGRALSLSQDDLRLHYLRATEREMHGEPNEALEAYLDVIVRASRSRDPLAPAMAEVAAAEVQALDDIADDYVDRVTAALDPLHADPGSIGEAARNTIAELLIDLAFRSGDVERASAVAAAQRCPTQWKIAGPFGPRHLLGFDRALAPEEHPELAETYDYGPSRGVRPTRTVRPRGCNVHLGTGPVGGPGTTYAETVVQIDEPGSWVLRIETPNAVELFVDGRSIAKIDRRRQAIGRTSYHAVELTAGAHRVRAKVTTRHPNPVVALTVSRANGPVGGGRVEGESLTAEHLRVQRAMTRGDVVFARERVRPHLQRDGSAAFLILGAAASLNDPLRSSEVRHDTARRLLRWAQQRDEHAWFPLVTLGQLDANEGRDVAAIASMREATDRWPHLVVFPLSLVDLYEQRGWHAQADEAIERAHRTAPDACRPRRAMLNQARRRARAEDEIEQARGLITCDARSDALLTTLMRRRDWAGAAQELARMAALEPEPSTVGEIQGRLALARSQGDDEAVVALIQQLAERIPQGDGPVIMEADRVLARGNEQEARAGIAEALTREPEAMMEVRRVLRAIGGESPLEAHRKDGAEVIREFEASGRTYREPMVLVLDYTVYRVFEDGSMLELTHNIYRLQSQEAVDAMGEYEVPEGAHMLTMQTVKADGRRLEPDEIAGKDTISFPSLAVGDYVEFEYMRGRGAPAGYPGGFTGDRFFFRNYETPFDLSQLTVLAPPQIELTVDPRGQAPETEQAAQDGLRMYRWTVRESRPLVQEPGSVSSQEFFPSIYWGHGATWPLYVESLRDVLADRDVRDPAAERLVREVVGERAGERERAERLYRWVLANVEDSEDVFGLAPAMLASRTGNRSRVLRYLLELAGLEADLVLVRAYSGDATASDLADDDTYQNLLVRMRGTDGPTWLFVGARGAPFGHVPPVLAGMDALVLNEEAERTTVTPRPLEADLRTVEVDVELTRDGAAQVSVVETFRGAGAVSWRNELEGIPEADLEAQFESGYVSNLLPGGRLTRLVITGRDDADEPLTMRYDVEMGSLARASAGGLVVPPLFRAHFGPQFAPVAARTTTELVPAGFALDVIVRLRAGGAQVAAAPANVELAGVNGARVTIQTNRDDGGLEIRRSYRVPRMRVAPAEYPEFARFARAVDEAESSEVRLRSGG